MTLILTQEGIERIWEFYEDPYLTDEESETDSILRLLSQWGPKGAGGNAPWGSHQPPKFPGLRQTKGPFPFEKEDFMNSVLRKYGPQSTSMDRDKIERILSGLYDVGYIDDVEHVRGRDRRADAFHDVFWYSGCQPPVGSITYVFNIACYSL